MSAPRRDRVTLIVVPDETAPVRRFQIPRALLRYGAWGAALLSLLVIAGLVDWVRLRIDAYDVQRLRSEATLQRDKLTALTTTVQEVEAGLARIREFERKVRVIADLPQAMAEVASPAVSSATAGDQGLPTGPAGGDDPLFDLPPAPPGPPGVHDAEIVGWIEARAEHLALLTHARSESLEDLIEQLEGKSHHLASTPSIWPTDGWVTSGFGYRTSPFTGRRQFHRGIDVAADPGTAILAPARGKVVAVGRKGPLGRAVTLEHGYGIRTTYGHVQEIFVDVGKEVARGDRIASVGNTGRSTGPHLHYGLTLNGRSVDPSDYILE